MLLLDDPTGQILPRVLYALESYLSTVFNGGTKHIPYPEQAGRLTKFLNARRSRATWVANGVVLNIFLFFNFVVLSCPCALALYVTGQEQPNLEGPRSTDEGPRSTGEGPRSTDEGPGIPSRDPGLPRRDPGLPIEGPGSLVRVRGLPLRTAVTLGDWVHQ